MKCDLVMVICGERPACNENRIHVMIYGAAGFAQTGGLH
jgi:hypothetical protein